MNEIVSKAKTATKLRTKKTRNTERGPQKSPTHTQTHGRATERANGFKDEQKRWLPSSKNYPQKFISSRWVFDFIGFLHCFFPAILSNLA